MLKSVIWTLLFMFVGAYTFAVAILIMPIYNYWWWNLATSAMALAGIVIFFMPALLRFVR